MRSPALSAVQLAVLHLFRDTIDAEALRAMGDPEFRRRSTRCPSSPGSPARQRSRCWTAPLASACWSPLGGGYYAIHPALPWYFTTLFTVCLRIARQPEPPTRPPAPTPTPSAWLGDDYFGQDADGAG